MTRTLPVALLALALIGCANQTKRAEIPTSYGCGFLKENPEMPGYVICVLGNGASFNLKYGAEITVHGKTCYIPEPQSR